MSTTVRQLIEKLSKYNQDLEVILEPCIDVQDSERAGFIAYESKDNNSADILLRESLVQYDDGYDSYLFDGFEPQSSDKKVLIISSGDLKYGDGE